MTAAATNTSNNFDRHFRDQFEPDDDCDDCDARANDILVDFPERNDGNAAEIATPPTREKTAKSSKWKTSSHDDEKLHILLSQSSSSFRQNHHHSGTNFGNFTDTFVSHVGESLAGLALAERGWNSLGALSGAVSFPTPRDVEDRHAGSRAFEANGASNLAPAAARRRSSRMSATPAQIAAAVQWIREREEEEEEEGRAASARSSRSSRGSLFTSLEDIERYAQRNSVVRGGSENGRNRDDRNDAFDELRELMGDDAFLMDISERDEDEDDVVLWPDDAAGKRDGPDNIRDKTTEVDNAPGVMASRNGTDGKNGDLSTHQLRSSATGSSIGETERTKHAPATLLGQSNRKPRNKRKSVISLSPMCRISTALKEMFGDEVGPRCP